MFPYIIYSTSTTGLGVAAFHTLGLVFMTGFYYIRAITEERHLMADPYYQAYCQQVKYRFIPGVI
jgi:protein-S-isoprenylcysteine O-methyltransferase Ste14